jgi:hypothetical protein
MIPVTDLTSPRLPNNPTNTAPFSIRLIDADKESKPPLPGFRAKVERLDKDGKVDAILFAGRAGPSGDVNFALDLPKETAGQTASALATVRLTVFDLTVTCCTPKTFSQNGTKTSRRPR